MKKEYREFVHDLRRELLSCLGLGEDKIFFREKGTEITQEGDRLFIECMEHEEGKEVCGLFIRELYQHFCEGYSVKEIAEEIQKELERTVNASFFEKTKNLTDYDKVKGDLFIRLLNRERHKAELRTTVHRIIGDIALVLYMKVGEMNDCLTSVKIRQEYVDRWALDTDWVFEEALRNTAKITPPRVYRWERLVYDMQYQGEAFMGETADFSVLNESMGNCLSTSRRTNGAVAVFLPGVAEKLAELLGNDFYLVFTSVHEVMIHKVNTVDPEELRRVLKDTIREATPEEDFLTEQIYRYNRISNRFSLVQD